MTCRLKEDFSLAGEPLGTIGDGSAVPDADVKLGALGMADPLGAALWRAKYKGDPRARRQAVALIAHRLSTDRRWSLAAVPRARVVRGRRADDPTLPAGLVERLAFRVLHEWLSDHCTQCHGRGSVGQWGSVMRCRRCGGSRREPVQHTARAKDLGVTREAYHARWETVLDRILAKLEEVDNGVTGVLRGQLRVDTVRPNAEAPDAVSVEPCKRPCAHGQPSEEYKSNTCSGQAPCTIGKAHDVGQVRPSVAAAFPQTELPASLMLKVAS
jgi:hypothetical protein